MKIIDVEEQKSGGNHHSPDVNSRLHYREFNRTMETKDDNSCSSSGSMVISSVPKELIIAIHFQCLPVSIPVFPPFSTLVHTRPSVIIPGVLQGPPAPGEMGAPVSPPALHSLRFVQHRQDRVKEAG